MSCIMNVDVLHYKMLTMPSYISTSLSKNIRALMLRMYYYLNRIFELKTIISCLELYIPMIMINLASYFRQIHGAYIPCHALSNVSNSTSTHLLECSLIISKIVCFQLCKFKHSVSFWSKNLGKHRKIVEGFPLEPRFGLQLEHRTQNNSKGVPQLRKTQKWTDNRVFSKNTSIFSSTSKKFTQKISHETINKKAMLTGRNKCSKIGKK